MQTLPASGDTPSKALEASCRPRIHKPDLFKGLNISIPDIIPIKGRGFINQGSTFKP